MDSLLPSRPERTCVTLMAHVLNRPIAWQLFGGFLVIGTGGADVALLILNRVVLTSKWLPPRVLQDSIGTSFY